MRAPSERIPSSLDPRCSARGPTLPFVRSALAGSGLCVVLLVSTGHALAHQAREVRLVMGTTAEVRLEDPADSAAALDAAFAALARVDDAMSLWKESALTRLNDAGEGRVPACLLTVLRHALDVAQASHGAFDPTVEPLVRAAGGFGGSRQRLSDEDRKALLARVGFSRVRVDAGSARVTLARGTRLDLGGIAKGYAADLALEAARRAGARRVLVDLGQSSIRVLATRLVVALRDPERADAPPWGHFELSDGAVSTSGADQRPGHILDPRTGLPASRVLAATVVARSGIEADALSTAVYVLGPGDGLRLLERRGDAGFVLTREAGRRTIRTTRGFTAAYGLAAAPGVRITE